MLTTIVEAFGRLGAYEGAIFVISRIIERLSTGRARLIRYHFVAQPVAPYSIVARTAGKVVVRQAFYGDAALGALPRSEDVLNRRFRIGNQCFVAEIDGRFSGCLWLAGGTYAEDDVRCLYEWRPQEVAAWDYDVYVVPEARLSRTFVRMWEAAHQYLHAKGVRWTLSRISAFNRESLAAHRRLGAVRIGAGTFFLIGRLQVALLSALPYFHISVNANSRPHLVLSLERLDGLNSRSVTAQ